MMYVLVSKDTGKYVAKQGSPHAYTVKLQNAAIFPSYPIAMANACGNEYAENVEEIMS